MRTVLITLQILFIATTLYAAPTITGVTGTVNDAETIVLSSSGSDFGSKAVDAPQLWDTFEDGSHMACLTESGHWTAYQSYGGFYSNERAYSGSLSAYNYVNSAGGAYSGFNTSYASFVASDTVFLSYKFYYEVTGSGAGVGKLCRISCSTEGVYTGGGAHKYSNVNWNYSATGSYVSYDNSTTAETNIGYLTPRKDAWVTCNMYSKLSTAGVADGVCYVDLVGIGKKGSSAIENRDDGQTYQNDRVLLGLMYANIGYINPPASVKIYIDDVYIDNTWSRVELGNNSVYTSCTHREIHIPSAWAAGEITVTMNQGSFSEGDTVYFFVVDSAGTASAGYPAEGIEIGSTFGGANPDPPPVVTQNANISTGQVRFGGTSGKGLTFK